MSRIALLLLLVTLSLCGSLTEAQFPWFGAFGGKKADGVNVAWIEDPAEAIAASARSGKPIMAYVTSAHCGYCRKMERETWSEPAVGRLVERGFVPLKLDVGRNPDEVAALRIKAYPTTVLISPEGKAFAGHTGFMEPLELTELLRPALAQRNTAAPVN